MTNLRLLSFLKYVLICSLARRFWLFVYCSPTCALIRDWKLTSASRTRIPFRHEQGMARLENLVTGGFASNLLQYSLDLVKTISKSSKRMSRLVSTSIPTHVRCFTKHYSNGRRSRSLQGKSTSLLISIQTHPLFQGLTPNLAGSCTSWGIFIFLRV